MGLAYSLQIIGQKELEPTTAALIMSLESVFAAIGGWWLLKERMTVPEMLGCCLVFAAVVISQLPDRRK
jgi:drug/metabolite transporter (DMT)-like permease